MPSVSNEMIPKQINSVLGRMRRAVQRYFIINGLKNIFVVLLLIVISDFFIDKSFRMDKPQRLIMLILGLCCILFLAYKKLIIPLLSKLSDDALILELERTQGGMNESLISALELSRMRNYNNTDVSLKMIEETIEAGAQIADGVKVGPAFQRGKMKANFYFLVSLTLVLIIGGFGVVNSNDLNTWYKRNVLLMDLQWPSDYELQVVGLYGGKIRVAKGQNFSIKVQVKEGNKSVPESIKIEFKSNVYKKSEELFINQDGTFVSSAVDTVAESEFRVISKEYETQWLPLELVDRPELVKLSLGATFPEYTELGRIDLATGEGPHELLGGSELKISGNVNKPLKNAYAMIAESKFSLKVDGDSFIGMIPKNKLNSGSYSIIVEDNEEGILNGSGDLLGLGFKDSPKFRVRVVNDRKPKLTIKSNGLSGMIVPGALIPYVGEINDDFSIEDVEIIYSLKEDTGERREVSGKLVPYGIQKKIGSKEIKMDGAIDLEPLDLTINSRFSVYFSAKDNNTESGPGVGESTRILFRVVGEAELRTDLLRREKEQRQIVSELTKKQDILLTDLGAIAAEFVEIDILDRSSKERLANLQKAQKNLSVGVGNTVKRLKGMVLEIKNNRLEEEKGILQSRLNEKIIAPLELLTQQTFPSISLELDAARRMNDKLSRDKSFKVINEAQSYTVQVLKGVLMHMVRNEGYQQALNLLYEIQREQERMNQMTNKAKEKSLEGIVEDKKAESEAKKKEKSKK